MATAPAAEKRPLREDLADLLGAPRELWIIFFAKFLESLGIFSMLYTLTLWLSSDYAFSDVDAGWWVGTFNLTVSLITFGIGFFADSWGFRRTLILAFAVSALSRGTMAFAGTRSMALVGLMSLTLGYAGGVPVMNTAVRRYTYPSSRAFAFSLYYVTFNVSAAVAGVLVDGARNALKQPKLVTLPVLGEIAVSAYRAVYMVGLVVGIAALACSLLLRKDVDLEKPTKRYEPGHGMASAFLAFMTFMSLMVVVQMVGEMLGWTMNGGLYAKAAAGSALLSGLLVGWLRTTSIFQGAVAAPELETPAAAATGTTSTKAESPLAVAKEVMSERAFWRFMLFIALLVFVKLIFSHSHFTFPKYALRELGQSFPLGIVQAINPIMIIVLVPVATALTRHMSAFWVIVLGSIVTALSPFVLVAGATWTTILLMTVILSLGECLWSPRLYEYTATIAPRGREASYMGLSSLPMFFAKMAVGPLSGYLLATYCPEYGTVGRTLEVGGSDAPVVVHHDEAPTPPALALVSPARVGRDVELAVTPGLAHGKRMVRCDKGDGGKPFETTPSAKPKVSLFAVDSTSAGTRTVRCVTVDEAGRESAPVTESIGVVAGGKALSAPTIEAPAKAETGAKVELAVTAGAASDGTVHLRCIAPGGGDEATQTFQSGPVAGGTTVKPTFSWTTTGSKSVYCTTFDEAGGASARQSGVLWLVIGVMTLLGPLLLLALRGVIEGKDAAKTDDPEARAA